MEPDAFGIAFGTGVLATVLVLFGLAVRLVTGAVGLLSYTIGRAVADGMAAWTGSDPASRRHASPSDGGGSPLAELEAPVGAGPRLERLGSARTKLRCAAAQVIAAA